MHYGYDIDVIIPIETNITRPLHINNVSLETISSPKPSKCWPVSQYEHHEHHQKYKFDIHQTTHLLPNIPNKKDVTRQHKIMIVMKNRSGQQFSMMSEEPHRKAKQIRTSHDQNSSAIKQARSKPRRSKVDIKTTITII